MSGGYHRGLLATGMLLMLKLRLIKQAMRQGGFSRSAVSEGELLVAGGGVMGLEVAVAAGEVGVRARVRDAEGTCFDVEARVLTGTATMRAEGECSCARGHGCRHVAAALVALTLKRSVAVGPAVHPELTHWAATLKGEAALGGESGVMVCYFLLSARVGMVLQLSVRVVLVELGRNAERSQGRGPTGKSRG